MSTIVQMDKQRIETILAIANRLTEYIIQFQGSSTYRKLQRNAASNYASFAAVLTQIAREVRLNGTTLMSPDEFLRAFPESTTGYKSDWMAARALLMLQVTNRLAAEAPALVQPQTETTDSIRQAKAHLTE